ncbi:proton-coupled folate transporter-like [Babylonia areolata]|uniref:proton-coupled folate transporter-like n=1 Tax=Babylonia areolata TaxID=304850 RepID=UPI003FD67C21
MDWSTIDFTSSDCEDFRGDGRGARWAYEEVRQQPRGREMGRRASNPGPAASRPATGSSPRDITMNSAARGGQMLQLAASLPDSNPSGYDNAALSRSWHGEKRTTGHIPTANGISTPADALPSENKPRSDLVYQTPVKKTSDDAHHDGDDNYPCDGDDGIRRRIQHKASVDVVRNDGGDGGGGGREEDEERKRLKWRLMVSVVVVLVAYITAMIAMMPVLSQYLLRRAAMEYFNLTNVTLKQTPCADSNSSSSLQRDLNIVQAQTSHQLLYLDLSQYIFVIFVALLAGSYADYLGRKFLVLGPVLGSFLKSVVVLLVVYLDLAVDVLYLGYLLDGLMGSFYVLEIGLFAAIADVTVSAKERVVMFALLEISLAVAGALSQIGTGFLIETLGFAVPSLVICCLFLVTFVAILLLMPETLRSRPERMVLNPLVHLRKVFGFYFWDGPVRRRALFVCGLLLLFFIVMINLGRMPLETLYWMNSPFCWSSVRIGLFMGLRLLLQNLVGVSALKLLSKCLRIELIAVLGLLSGIAGFVLESLAQTDLYMFVSGVVGMLITVVTPVNRTLLSRMAPADSQGALFASLSAVETLCHLSASMVFNNVYSATLNDFPGTVFMLMAVILLIDLILLIVFSMMARNFPLFHEVQVEVKTDGAEASLPQTPPSTARHHDDERTPLLVDGSGCHKACCGQG